MDQQTLLRLKRACELAGARLDVAETFKWVVAVLAAMVVHTQWDDWFLTVVAGLVGFVLSTQSYKAAATKAEDAYFSAAKLEAYSPFTPSDE